jgi:hypothetical protein
MELVQTMDDYGKLAWIALMVVSFIVFWPLGLAILFYLIWSGRMGCKSRAWKYSAERKWRRACASFQSTGNTAFDEYREETLRRLEQEADEFRAFLERLRAARDKAEFDQFMAERDGNEKENGDNAGVVPQAG